MKFLNRAYYILISVLGVGLLSGCLKDANYNNGVTEAGHLSGNQNVVEISITATSTSNFQFLSVNSSANDTTIKLVPVTLASPGPAAKDVHVTLKLDQSVLSAYNTANGTSYTLPPTNIYTIVSNVVTIPAGSNVGYLQVKFTPNNFLIGGLAFAFSIASVDAGYTISGNLNTGVVAIGVKNTWDGQYTLRIKTVGWSAYGISDNLPGTFPGYINLETAGATTNNLYSTYTTSYLQTAFTTGNAGATQFGVTTPQFAFDPATNKITSVTNTTPDDGRGRKLQLNASVTDSRYDPSTKIIYAAYIMLQNGRPSQYIYDTLTYVGPR